MWIEKSLLPPTSQYICKYGVCFTTWTNSNILLIHTCSIENLPSLQVRPRTTVRDADVRNSKADQFHMNAGFTHERCLSYECDISLIVDDIPTVERRSKREKKKLLKDQQINPHQREWKRKTIKWTPRSWEMLTLKNRDHVFESIHFLPGIMCSRWITFCRLLSKL